MLPGKNEEEISNGLLVPPTATVVGVTRFQCQLLFHGSIQPPWVAKADCTLADDTPAKYKGRDALI